MVQDLEARVQFQRLTAALTHEGHLHGAPSLRTRSPPPRSSLPRGYRGLRSFCKRAFQDCHRPAFTAFFFFLISLARGLSVFGHFQKLHSNLFSLFLVLYSLIPLFYFPLFFLLTLALVCSFFSSSDLRPFLFSYQRKQWQPNPVLLPGKSYGRRRLQSMGLRRLGHD